MYEIYDKLHAAGYVVVAKNGAVSRGCRFCCGTSCDFGIKKVGESEPSQWYPYELLIEKIQELLSQKIRWSAMLRFNRGLGSEHRMLDCIDAYKYDEAKNIGERLAEKFCHETPGMEKAKIIEVRVSPFRLPED